jgi:membrane fusion protein, heavy metal efflux system
MKKLLILCSLLATISISCKNTSSEHSHGGESHDHGEAEGGLEALSYTLYTDKTELFVEFKPLVVGQSRNFAAHLTELKAFKPLTSGAVTVSLIKGDNGIRNTVNGPSSPGIFRPALQPKEAGQYQLVFDIKTEAYTDQITIDSIRVYPDEKTALSDQKVEPAGNEITYLKEQAWKTDFANAPARQMPFYEVIKTTGQIMPSQADQVTVTAQANGIIDMGTDLLLAGKMVSKGQPLFSITGSGLSEDNINTRYQQASAAYEKANLDYQRAQELVKDQIIPRKEFLDIQLRYENAKTVFNTLSKNYRAGAQQITSPMKGFIKNVYVTQGQYVEAGQPIASIAQNQKLLLKSEVPQQYFPALNTIFSANFRTSYDEHIYGMEELNGKLVSYGKTASEDAFFMPVYFEIDNKGELIPGSYVEVFLKANSLPNALVIPHSALMEEQGSYYVYVQTAGESFEKREVKLGASDAAQVQVLSGVRPGERVVTKGAYQIKLSSLSGALPAHGHEH